MNTKKTTRAGNARKTTRQSAKASQPDNAFRVKGIEGDTAGLATARAVLIPDFRHAVTVSQIHKAQFGNMDGAPGLADYSDAIGERTKKAEEGDLAFASHTLAAQAVTLDNLFTELARRMALNMGEYLGATETYARIALKAQAQSRATLEALAKLHQPREQTVRHVHVNDGGQAVIADEFHNHPGGMKDGQSNGQSDATETAGASPALPCPNPLGDAVSIPSRERKAAMQDARRD